MTNNFKDLSKEVKKQNFLFQEKNKEADERINGLLDELDLEKGIREEMKLEQAKLKEQVEKVIKEKEASVENQDYEAAASHRDKQEKLKKSL